jgi:hypothetical protein
MMSGRIVSRPRGPGAIAAKPEILAVVRAAVSQSCADLAAGAEAVGSDDTGMVATKFRTALPNLRTTLLESGNSQLSAVLVIAI